LHNLVPDRPQNKMTKLTQNDTSSVPSDPYEVIPPDGRTEEVFQNEIKAWLAKQFPIRSLRGPAFMDWITKATEQNREIFWELFHRYGIRPALLLETLEANKRMLLSRQQLESGLWLKDWPHLATMAARLGLPDTAMAKTQRNKKLREKKAKMLDNAAAVLDDYPFYIPAILNALLLDRKEPDEILFDLPKYIRAIAADMRERGRVEKHRPKEAAARMVLESLTDSFRLAVKRPLYEYAGLLTKACFPEEWNPADDIREAAKKLVKLRK
jgi:hypothetical protein